MSESNARPRPIPVSLNYCYLPGFMMQRFLSSPDDQVGRYFYLFFLSLSKKVSSLPLHFSHSPTLLCFFIVSRKLIRLLENLMLINR